MMKEMASGTAMVSPGLISPAASTSGPEAPRGRGRAESLAGASLPNSPSIDIGLLEMFWMKATSSTIWRMWIEKSTPPPHSGSLPGDEEKIGREAVAGEIVHEGEIALRRVGPELGARRIGLAGASALSRIRTSCAAWLPSVRRSRRVPSALS